MYIIYINYVPFVFFTFLNVHLLRKDAIESNFHSSKWIQCSALSSERDQLVFHENFHMKHRLDTWCYVSLIVIIFQIEFEYANDNCKVVFHCIQCELFCKLSRLKLSIYSADTWAIAYCIL